MIPGLFLRDKHIIGLSEVFRFPWIPLGISVEDRALEIAGLDSESGLRLGDSTRENIAVILDFFLAWSYSSDILASVFTVFQFRVVASTDSSFSMTVLESLVLPYPFGQWR